MMRVTDDSQYPAGDVKYAANARGLAACYFMGAKFSDDPATRFGFALPLVVSDLLFSGLLFGLHYGASRRASRGVPALAGGAS